MPELPEVETIRRHLAPHVEGRPLDVVEIRDARWCRPLAPAEVEAALRPRKNLKLIVHLERPGADLAPPLERLPLRPGTEEMMGVPIGKVTIPVAAGRNLAVLTEAAVQGKMDRLRGLTASCGERAVFAGSPRAQATPELLGWPQLIAVTDLASALAAVEEIIEQGEGCAGDWRTAHYGRLLAMWQEYRDLQAAIETGVHSY